MRGGGCLRGVEERIFVRWTEIDGRGAGAARLLSKWMRSAGAARLLLKWVRSAGEGRMGVQMEAKKAPGLSFWEGTGALLTRRD
jgi:hypothetical protein